MTDATVCDAIESIIASDPGNRGIGPLVQPGSLALAAHHLASTPTHLAIFTGFIIPPAETDGPPGALAIALSIHTLFPDCLISLFCDEDSASVLEACFAPLLDDINLHVFPAGAIPPNVLNGLPAMHISHAVAIERVGPSCVDGLYYTMMGRDVTPLHAWLHEIWEALPATVVKIGIGDGGNEMGMGKVSHLVMQHVPRGALIACRCSCDVLIVAGVSNWAGTALAACLLGSKERFQQVWGEAEEIAAVERCVEAGAIDGVLKQSVVSVDGFSMETMHREIRQRIENVFNR
jgi:hypothetical protein